MNKTCPLMRVIEIAVLKNEGKSYKDIGKILGISRQRAHQILQEAGDLQKRIGQCKACYGKIVRLAKQLTQTP